jgi:ribulose-phosphate 3-epimerase
MSVNPGFGGQQFITSAVDKVRELNAFKTAHGLGFIIEVDGGVNGQNAALLREAGANALVAGSYVFNAPDPVLCIHELSIV